VLDLLDEMKRIGKPRPFVVGRGAPDLPYLGNTAEVPLTCSTWCWKSPGPAHTPVRLAARVR
jgi:hypothetical protein